VGIINEINAEITAKRLEQIILNSINSDKYGDMRSAVKSFVKQELIEWYFEECSETWGSYNPNPEIVKLFDKK
jgi:hypothetical protein